MKSFSIFMIVFAVMICPYLMQSQTAEDYVNKARDFNKKGDIDQAIKTMTEAVKKYPKNALICSYLGLFTGMKAGKTKDFMEAGRIINEAYIMLDKAVLMDPDHPLPRFHRGLMGVNIPEFLGKLDQAIMDLETMIKISKKSQKKVSKDILLSGYSFLATGYKKKKDKQRAILVLKEIVKLAPKTDMAIKAEKEIKVLTAAKKTEKTKKKRPDPELIKNLKKKIKDEPKNSENLIALGKAYIDIKDYMEARKVLKKAVELNKKSLDAYKLLIFAVGEIASKGYDERIYEDTDLRTNLAFELSGLVDRACAIAPEDVEIRLLRGTVGVQMPFFVGKLDQAIKDLNWIIKSNAPDSTKAEAFYWLGIAYQKKATTSWIKVVTKYPKTKASEYVFNTLHPPIKRVDFSKHKKPFLAIDFLLGFRDELAPQTSVWVENKNGTFIKTLYVSGFSGFAKEQQINLPKWSKSSNFTDVDGVTGASIDLGHHIFVWDLKDKTGTKVKPGEYIIKLEVHFWPSMEYQFVSATIKLGNKHERVISKERGLIPYLELKYYPAD